MPRGLHLSHDNAARYLVACGVEPERLAELTPRVMNRPFMGCYAYPAIDIQALVVRAGKKCLDLAGYAHASQRSRHRLSRPKQ